MRRDSPICEDESSTAITTEPQTFHLRNGAESSTQTSKTILQLAQIEQMFAHKKEKMSETMPYLFAHTVRKNEVFHTACTDPDLTYDSEQSNSSLIATFLTRKQNMDLLHRQSKEQPAISRFRVKKCPATFKDQQVFYHEGDNARLGPRTKCSQIKLNHSVRKSSMRNTSFMSPTIASEQKNQLKAITTVTQSIPPARMGKALSPGGTYHFPNLSASLPNTTKIPYIDQSLTNLHLNRSHCLECPIPKNEMQCIEGSGTHLSDCTDSCSNFIAGPIAAAIAAIKDKDWNASLTGFSKLTELCRMVDPDLIYPYMTAVNQRLIQLLRSPRSYVSRTACRAACHFFEYVKDTRQPEFDDIVEILLYKTADSSKFIRQDANLALDCMVTHIPAANAIRSLCLKGPHHKNGLVRAATIRILVCAVVIASPQAILTLKCYEPTRKRIVENLLRFIDDKNADTRKYGIRLYRIMENKNGFKTCLKKYLRSEDYEKLERAMTFLNHRCYSTYD